MIWPRVTFIIGGINAAPPKYQDHRANRQNLYENKKSASPEDEAL
jgi:hypothetical protein